MESPAHNITALFDQLGLNSADAAIDAFVVANKPIAKHIPLYSASCWSVSQAAFLKDAIEQDADWAEVVDHLDAMLR
jgi:hypothetical protein